MQVLEPELVQVSQTLTLNNGGGVDPMDFSLGNLEGLLITRTELVITGGLDASDFLTGLGLSINPAAVSPATLDALVADPDVIALRVTDALFTTSGAAWADLTGYREYLTPVLVARNLSFLGFETAASNVTARARVYFKRVIFTQAELVGQIAVRR